MLHISAKQSRLSQSDGPSVYTPKETPTVQPESMPTVNRNDIAKFDRILIKVGSAVLTNDEGHIALGRVGHLVEQISSLVRAGKQVILVSSGSTALGRKKLHRNNLLRQPLSSYVHGRSGSQGSGYSYRAKDEARCSAAAGQSHLLSFYEFMFGLNQVECAQVLVTEDDFDNAAKRNTMRRTLTHLLSLGIVPIINENDVVSTREEDYEYSGTVHSASTDTLESLGEVQEENESPRTTEQRPERPRFRDNDGLAVLVSVLLRLDSMLLLSDVEGLFELPPKEVPKGQANRLIHTVCTREECKRDGLAISSKTPMYGSKSSLGRGGFSSKVYAATLATDKGVRCSIIASGFRLNVIHDIFKGQRIGTLFALNPADMEEQEGAVDYEQMAKNARQASRELQKLSTQQRCKILKDMATALHDNRQIILNANSRDMFTARNTNLAAPLMKRLELTTSKLDTLEEGMRKLAQMEEPIGRVVRRSEVGEGLILEQCTVPIGVLLVIFESRPDCLPQLISLALRSGNGLLLKGGKEARQSNTVLFKVLTDAITASTNGAVRGDHLLSLVESREAIGQLLKLHEDIDLAIPRGSKALVQHVMNSTRIPVMGHAEGICHIYIDENADIEKSKRICVDSKTDYPAACNAVETILVHKKLLENHKIFDVLESLREKDVQIHGGDRASRMLSLQPMPADGFRTEYGDLGVTVEIVESMEDAIAHINKYGSHHTDSIVTENHTAAERFLRDVDSADVFHNTSTRFADGFRFGLGAEVGISTARIGARGPVGVDGLLTHKWTMRSTSSDGHTASDFASGKCHYTHRPLPLTPVLPAPKLKQTEKSEEK